MMSAALGSILFNEQYVKLKLSSNRSFYISYYLCLEILNRKANKLCFPNFCYTEKIINVYHYCIMVNFFKVLWYFLTFTTYLLGKLTF